MFWPRIERGKDHGKGSADASAVLSSVLPAVAVQSLLVQRLQDLARHEMDCRRIVATLVRLAKGCRLGSEQVRSSVIASSLRHSISAGRAWDRSADTLSLRL